MSAAGEVRADRITVIIDCEQKADAHLAEADALRWQAAELIAAELADGKTQRQLAEEIGKSQPHVCYMAAVWQRSLDNPGYRDQQFECAHQQAKTSAAALSEEARLTAVSYRTVVYDPAGLMLSLFGGTDLSRL